MSGERSAWGGAASRFGPAPSGIREALAGASRGGSYGAGPPVSSPLLDPVWEGQAAGASARWPRSGASLGRARGEGRTVEPASSSCAVEDSRDLLQEAHRSRPDISGARPPEHKHAFCVRHLCDRCNCLVA